MLAITQVTASTAAAVLGPIVGLAVGLTGLILGYVYNKRLLDEKKHEEERKEIYKKLNSFYGPALFLLDTSRELYERFTLPRGDDFRTLVALLEGEKFEGNDAVLLQQIFEVTAKLEELIYTQSGLVEDEELQKLLARAGAHFRILRLAYEGNLTGDKERFEDYVFPRELTDKIREQSEKLQNRLKELNNAEESGENA